MNFAQLFAIAPEKNQLVKEGEHLQREAQGHKTQHEKRQLTALFQNVFYLPLAADVAIFTDHRQKHTVCLDILGWVEVAGENLLYNTRPNHRAVHF